MQDNNRRLVMIYYSCGIPGQIFCPGIWLMWQGLAVLANKARQLATVNQLKVLWR